eukprot:scaffold70261_cov32-Tisochrysis_lutea.AAC.1
MLFYYASAAVASRNEVLPSQRGGPSERLCLATLPIRGFTHHSVVLGPAERLPASTGPAASPFAHLLLALLRVHATHGARAN